jgi:hypothetical protein
VLLLALALALDEPDLPLLPLGSVHRPAPVEDTEAIPPRCAAQPLASIKDRLPFGPGEFMSFDITLAGIRTGRVNMKVGDRVVIDGVATFPLQAQATTDSFLDFFGHFDARMVSFLDPSTMLPVRMVNHVVAKQPFVDTPVDSREDAAFAKGRLAAHLRRTSKDPAFDMTQHLNTASDVVDVLSVVYYLRGHELDEGTPFCFELYHRRRLWHVEGTVGAVEVVQSPAGARAARRLDAVVTRIGSGVAPPPRPVTAWLSDDADRFPVLVSTPDKLGDIEVKLTSFVRGRRLVAR